MPARIFAGRDQATFVPQVSGEGETEDLSAVRTVQHESGDRDPLHPTYLVGMNL